MKFLKEEYQDLVNSIQKQDLVLDDFTFSKKKGMLFVKYQEQDNQFCFFRKKESLLNHNLQFEDRDIYFIGLKKEKTVENWTALLEYFQDWLSTIRT